MRVLSSFVSYDFVRGEQIPSGLISSFRPWFSSMALLFWLFVVSNGTCYGQVANGTIDLSQHDFSQEPTRELNGPWRYMDGVFINPLNTDGIEQYRQVPGLWNTSGHGTFALKVLLPVHKPTMGIRVPDIYTSYQLTINGIYIGIKGYAADNEEQSIPFRKVEVFPIPPELDSLEIVLHVSNYHHSKRGIKDPIIIGDLIDLEHQLLLARTFDIFIGGCAHCE